jgi:hypothetical protein
VLGLNDAIGAVMRDNFAPASATLDDPQVRALLTFFETVGTLTKNGLLDQGLVLDWLWAAGIWDRVGAAALREREKHGEPKLYENFEALAQAQSAG